MARTRALYPLEFRQLMVELVRIGRRRSCHESSSLPRRRSATGWPRPTAMQVVAAMA